MLSKTSSPGQTSSSTDSLDQTKIKITTTTLGGIALLSSKVDTTNGLPSLEQMENSMQKYVTGEDLEALYGEEPRHFTD